MAKPNYSKVPFYRYKQLLRYPVRQLGTLLVILGLTVLVSLLAALQPWPLKILVDYALGESIPASWVESSLYPLGLTLSPSKLIIIAGVASLGVFLVNSLVNVWLSWTWTAAGQRMVYDLAGDLFDRLQRLSIVIRNRQTIGDSLSRITEDSYVIYSVTAKLLVTPVQELLTLGMVGAVAWRLDPKLTIFSLAVSPLMAGAAVVLGPLIKRRARERQDTKAGVVAFVHQILTTIPLVQVFRSERRNAQKFKHIAANSVAAQQRVVILESSYDFINGFSMTLGIALVLFTGSREVLSGSISVGSLLIFIAYIRTMTNAFKNLFNAFRFIKVAEANLDRVMEVLDIEDSVQDKPGAKEISKSSVIRRHQICLDNVSFGYVTDRPVLQQIDLKIEPGETIALVGTTGAGKSTLISLIPRFVDPWSGRVLLNGVDIREFKIANLRAEVALVLQDPFLLPLSVADNIAYGRPDASVRDIVNAAEAANAVEFIECMENDYQTIIGEHGATLSGGQKQRLAIARALLKDAPILIMDEPTSAVDMKTEESLLRALERLMIGRTTLIVAHRLSTIQRADRIVVLDDGRIIEEGTLQSLLASNGHFRRLYNLQFQKK